MPTGLDFDDVQGMRIEARQKLNTAHPETVGHARRTPGVTATDIGALLVHLETIGHRSTPRPRDRHVLAGAQR